MKLSDNFYLHEFQTSETAETVLLTTSLYYYEIVLISGTDKYTSGLETIESVEMLTEV